MPHCVNIEWATCTDLYECSVQVDELLKSSLSRFCAARSIPNNVGKQLLALAKSLLQLTRRHMKPSVVLSDAAACAMLALALVVEIPPTAAVVDDLCVGQDVQGLKTAYFWPLYRAVYDLCVKHCVVSGAYSDCIIADMRCIVLWNDTIVPCD